MEKLNIYTKYYLYSTNFYFTVFFFSYKWKVMVWHKYSCIKLVLMLTKIFDKKKVLYLQNEKKDYQIHIFSPTWIRKIFQYQVRRKKIGLRLQIKYRKVSKYYLHIFWLSTDFCSSSPIFQYQIIFGSNGKRQTELKIIEAN